MLLALNLLRVLPTCVLLQKLCAQQHVLVYLLFCVGRLLAFERLVQLASWACSLLGMLLHGRLWLVLSLQKILPKLLLIELPVILFGLSRFARGMTSDEQLQALQVQ